MSKSALRRGSEALLLRAPFPSWREQPGRKEFIIWLVHFVLRVSVCSVICALVRVHMTTVQQWDDGTRVRFEWYDREML